MPVFPEITVDMPQYCDLRQGLQWLKDDLRPVNPQFEAALGYSGFDSNRDYSREKAAIYAALLAGKIRLLGRFGQGDFTPMLGYDSPADWHYEDHEELPVTRIIEAGFRDLSFESGKLFNITEWEDECGPPSAGWQYVDLIIPTADLMRVFPPSNSFEKPITIELKSPDPGRSSTPAALPRLLLFLYEAVERIADYTGDAWSEAAAALHNALCSGELTADAADGKKEVPCGVWRSYSLDDFVDCIKIRNVRWREAGGLSYYNPRLTAKSVDSWLLRPEATGSKRSIEPGFVQAEHHVSVERSRVQIDALPVYLQFLNEIVSQLGGSHGIAERKKAEIEAEIAKRWRPELGQRSNNLIGMMATILRPPEAQRGGAKPMRPMDNSASREGWNGFTLPDEEISKTEGIEGGTV